MQIKKITQDSFTHNKINSTKKSVCVKGRGMVKDLIVSSILKVMIGPILIISFKLKEAKYGKNKFRFKNFSSTTQYKIKVI